MAGHFLIQALPPETDYITYLTLIEYNLTTEHLESLHQILQDLTLTKNIGWDLVHILLPFLPASAQCLQDVARLGNPREVILKVTELLQTLGESIIAEEEEGSDDVPSEIEQDHHLASRSQSSTEDEKRSNFSLQSSKHASSLPQYVTLLNMLSILHPRITTKYPSRFLSTSLQTVLPVYSQLAAVPEATSAVLSLTKTISRIQRPPLPPRKSNTLFSTIKDLEAEADPESLNGTSDPGEMALSNRLLQAFVTHVLEEYMNALRSGDDVPALAWTSRLQEKLQPDKVIPGRKTFREIFDESKILQERDEVTTLVTVSSVNSKYTEYMLNYQSLAQDLHLDSAELLSVVMKPEAAVNKDNDDLPSSAADVPLSHTGSLYLLSATIAVYALNDTMLSIPNLSIFPHHTAILDRCINLSLPGTISMQSEALIDSILFIGCFAVSKKKIGSPSNDAEFKSYLYQLSMISTDTPSPTLRYHAHYLLTTILQSHPSESLRLNFIREILEQSEYENLKVSAVGWFKDEVLALRNESADSDSRQTSLYTEFTALMPLLFPNIPHQFKNLRISEQRYGLFQLQIPFYLATLNLLYFLSFPPYFEQLEVASLCEQYDIRHTFLGPLGSTCKRLTAMLDEQLQSKAIDEADCQAQKMDLMLVENMLQTLAGRVFGESAKRVGRF